MRQKWIKTDHKIWHVLWKCTKKVKIIAIYQKKCKKGEGWWKDKLLLGGGKASLTPQKSYCSQFDFKINRIALFYIKDLDKGG